MTQIEQLAQNVLRNEKRAIARAITIVENNMPEAEKLIAAIYPHTGKAYVIGITGPTGSGKSTLIEKLVEKLRKSGKTVGVVAVDPTSPFTGGAFLGDRIRMQKLSTDEGVFIRSMASRNSLGGIAKTTKDVVRILDAAGKDVIIVETVGAGQTEIDIINVAHTVVVVLAPGLGDEIQAIKAGMMEIGDIFLVNKADRENANKAVSDIQAMLELNPEKKLWMPPIIKTTAITGEGIDVLLEKLEEHRKFLETSVSPVRYKQRVKNELIEVIKQKTADFLLEDLRKKGELEELVQKVLARKIDPYSAINALLREKLKEQS